MIGGGPRKACSVWFVSLSCLLTCLFVGLLACLSCSHCLFVGLFCLFVCLICLALFVSLLCFVCLFVCRGRGLEIRS